MNFEQNIEKISSKTVKQPLEECISHEIKTFFELKLDFPMKTAAESIYKNLIHQIWDEIMNSRQFNLTMNTKFNFQNCLENETYITGFKEQKFINKIDLSQKNPKKRMIETSFDMQCEKRKKIEDISREPETKTTFFSIIFH